MGSGEQAGKRVSFNPHLYYASRIHNNGGKVTATRFLCTNRNTRCDSVGEERTAFRSRTLSECGPQILAR